MAKQRRTAAQREATRKLVQWNKTHKRGKARRKKRRSHKGRARR